MAIHDIVRHFRAHAAALLAAWVQNMGVTL